MCPIASPEDCARVRMVVDDREPRPGLADALGARWEFVVVGRLPVGDVEVGPRVLVERKTASDFVSSLDDGRLFRQLGALGDACASPLLIVEGEDAYEWARLDPRAARGVLLTILVGFRVPLLRTRDVEETADVVAHIAAQEARRLARLATPPGPRPARVAMDLLASIPGVGDHRARRLLDAFETVRGVVEADDAALLDVPDVGPATVRALRRATDGARAVSPTRDGPPFQRAPDGEVREAVPAYG